MAVNDTPVVNKPPFTHQPLSDVDNDGAVVLSRYVLLEVVDLEAVEARYGPDHVEQWLRDACTRMGCRQPLRIRCMARHRMGARVLDRCGRLGMHSRKETGPVCSADQPCREGPAA